jgi:SAM-dependent methyltransferase
MSGVVPRECNLCGFTGMFVAFGDPPRWDAECPKCKAKERHRLLGLWMAGNLDEARGKHVLHFAPEPSVRRLLERRASKYVSADIEPKGDSIGLDIEKIDLQSESFDVVVCSHILEHVEHKQALREIWRVLKPRGLAILMFPIVEGWDESYCDPSITAPAGRRLHFGQWDHVRYFGSSVRNDIRWAGFDLAEFTAVEPSVSRYGLLRGEKVFLATKQQG